MKRRSVLVLLAVTQLACATSKAPLADRIERIAAASGHEVAVSFHDLETGASYERRANENFHAASTMKVPVMLALFEAISRGELQVDQMVPVRNEFTSIVDGSKYVLIREEDGDPALYDHVGSEVALEELMRRMIVRSSNLATNLLIEYVGAPKVMSLMKSIGASDIRVLRGVEDEKAFAAGMNNTTTAHDLMLVLRTIAEEKAITAEASRKMADILAAQEFTEGIPAGVPSGTRVANKTGSITRIYHDAAIVYPAGRRPYILVVLTRGFANSDAARPLVQSISREVWNEVTQQVRSIIRLR